MRVAQNLFLAVLLLIAAFSPGCAAQEAATLNVTVQDVTGAVVSGASLTLVSPQSSRNAKTAENGVASIQSLPPGKFSLEVASPGFTKYVMQNIVLHNKESRDLSVTLQVSSLGSCGTFQPAISYESQAENVSLSGKFNDIWDESVGGAVFEVTISGQGKVLHTTSSKDGTFQFTDLLPGKYSLVSKSKAYYPLPKSEILITHGKLTRIIFPVVRKHETRTTLCL
jgi:uncharacterized surface anchored protein